PVFAIYINIAVLAISGLITLLMPNVEDYSLKKETNSTLLSFTMLKQDFFAVKMYYSSHIFILILCLLFGGLMVVMASAVDSLEASFATFVLMLSESDYGLLVSIAGIGMGAGAIVNVAVVKKLTPFSLIIMGVLGNCFGYCVYAFSSSFSQAALGFFILAFF